MKRKTTEVNKAILIDSDVLIHFSIGGDLSMLNYIYPQYEKWILDVIEGEIAQRYSSAHTQLQFLLDQNIFKRVAMPDVKTPVYAEFVRLTRGNRRIGEGEAACMAFARFNEQVLASSNFKDIRAYCEEHEILYVSTMDLLRQAMDENILTEQVCNDFIAKVKQRGSKLPCNLMSEYTDERPLP